MSGREGEGHPSAGAAADAPVRIAYVLPNIENGGAEGHVLSLVRHLDRSRFSPFLVTTAGGGSLYEAFRSLLPVTVIGEPLRARSRPPRNPVVHLRTIRTLMDVFRSGAAGIVHTYLPAANVLGPVAARMAGVPRVVVSKRSLSDYKQGHPVLKHLESMGNRLADVVMVNSDAVRREVERTERHCEGKFRRIHNGVAPIEPWSPEEIAAFRARERLPAGGTVAVCVSNFFVYKGHAELVEAGALLARVLPDLTWVLIGRDAGSLDATRELARRLGVPDRFRFLGARSDVQDLLRAADLFVHPSHQEGFSNAILEAMAAGLPVVACDVGGNPEAVVDGETGRLVPPRDPERLAAAIRELLEAEGKRVAMGNAGRRRAEEVFPLAGTIREIEDMYESLAGQGDRKR